MATGTPQANEASGHIGPLPNLRAAAADFAAPAAAPAVTAVTPTGGAAGVPVGAAVSVTFDAAMDPATAEAAFALVPAGGGAGAPGPARSRGATGP